ncbi:mCG141832, partial [Mus musculus]
SSRLASHGDTPVSADPKDYLGSLGVHSEGQGPLPPVPTRNLPSCCPSSRGAGASAVARQEDVAHIDLPGL